MMEKRLAKKVSKLNAKASSILSAFTTAINSLEVLNKELDKEVTTSQKAIKTMESGIAKHTSHIDSVNSMKEQNNKIKANMLKMFE